MDRGSQWILTRKGKSNLRHFAVASASLDQQPVTKVSGLTAVRDDDILSASLEESAITDYAAKNIDLRTRARETNRRLR